MIRSTRLLDLSGLVLDKRNPSSMAIQLVHHNVAAGQSDKVNVFCQGCHDYVGEQECDVLRAKLTPQALYLLWLRTRLTPRAHHTRHARAMHAPCTRHAHATHTPRTHHARATHAPRTRHTHTHATHAAHPSPHVHVSNLPPHAPGARAAPAARAAPRAHAARRARRPLTRRACHAQAVAAAQLEPA